MTNKVLIDEVTTIKEFNSSASIKQELRSAGRNAALRVLSLKRNISKTTNWIQFPYYHHVFDDERKGFERQLRYLQNYGDFVSMDQACAMINGDEPINGRFFSVSFDDGFSSTKSNMVEITNKLNVPVIIYLPTNYIGLSLNSPADREKIRRFHPEAPKDISFLTWAECKEMLNHNVTFGSHTLDHVNLSKIKPEEIETELRRSKESIEAQLMVPCNHFACPWGRIGIDFDPAITTAISKKLGYKSFATTNRGTMKNGDDPFQLKRQHLLANWGTYQVNYFFGA